MLRRSVETTTLGILDALRDATRSRHAELAALPAMARLFRPDYTLTEYQTHLGRLLGLFEPLERAVEEAATPDDPAPDLHRSTHLVEDLSLMGASVEEIAALDRCCGLPPLPKGGLRGYTYVMLGSMLGGEIIVKRLSAVLGPRASFRFYGPGSGHYETHWAAFCEDLEQQPAGPPRVIGQPAAVEAICNTAIGIFDAYAAWLSQPLLPAGGRQ